MKKRHCPNCNAVIPTRSTHAKRTSNRDSLMRYKDDVRMVVPYRKSYKQRWLDDDAEEPLKPIRLRDER